MGQKLRYLGPEDRATIERLHNDRAPVALIAEKIGVHPGDDLPRIEERLHRGRRQVRFPRV